jgi:hypothetical protein
MAWANAVIAVLLAGLSLLHLDEPDGLLWMTAYGVGALLALTACKPALDVWSMRILGTAAALTMFLYLAGFFFRAPHLGAEWYAHEGNSGTLALLVAGFCMLPVVAGFTCRLKSARSGAEGED